MTDKNFSWSNFNNFSQVKSHSSALFNERLAIIFYLLDMTAIDANTTYKPNEIKKMKSMLFQIWKNARMLVRYNYSCRHRLHLETKIRGQYTIDLGFSKVNQMILYCEFNGGYTYDRCYQMVEVLNDIEMMIRDVLQYFNYFIRPDFKQKPDLFEAAERYKSMADAYTVDELKQVLGKNHHVDLNELAIAKTEEDLQLGNDDEESYETENESEEPLNEPEEQKEIELEE